MKDSTKKGYPNGGYPVNPISQQLNKTKKCSNTLYMSIPTKVCDTYNHTVCIQASCQLSFSKVFQTRQRKCFYPVGKGIDYKKSVVIKKRMFTVK